MDKVGKIAVGADVCACFGEDKNVSWRRHPMAYVRGCIIHVHFLQIYVVTKIKLIRSLCDVYVGMDVGVVNRPARLYAVIDVVEESFDVVIVREAVPCRVHHRLSLSYRGSYRFTPHHLAHHEASIPLQIFMMTMLRHSTEDCFDATFLDNGTAVCIVKSSHRPEG